MNSPTLSKVPSPNLNNFEHAGLPALIRHMTALVRARGVRAHDAEDIVQNTLLRLWSSRSAQRASWNHFQRFAFITVKHAHSSWIRAAVTAKRGGAGLRLVQLEEAGEIADRSTSAPDAIACQKELAEIACRSISAVREDYADRGNAELAKELEKLNTGQPSTSDRVRVSLRLGVKPGTLRVAAMRHRRRCRAEFSARREALAA